MVVPEAVEPVRGRPTGFVDASSCGDDDDEHPPAKATGQKMRSDTDRIGENRYRLRFADAFILLLPWGDR
jgi:hypothetical protein